MIDCTIVTWKRWYSCSSLCHYKGIFLTYDLAAKFNHENIILYADDTVLFGSDHKVLQDMLTNTHVWCEENLLTINCKKSQWMHTSIINKQAQHTLFHLGNIVLDQVQEYKYLGL